MENFNQSSTNNVVVLLSLNWYRRKDPRTPLGMAYIYSELANTFHSKIGIRLIEADVRDNLSNVIQEILVINPVILGIGVYAWNAEQTAKVIRALRTLGYIGSIILGGPEITYGGSELNEEFSEVQYFVKGFGENAFAELTGAILEGRECAISGVYRQGDEIHDTLAMPSYGISSSPFSNEELLYSLTGDGFIRWQTQRGCVYRCSFCAFRLPDNRIVESDFRTVEFELRKIAATGSSSVAILDPVFFLDKERAMSILELIETITPRVNFSIQTRYEHLDIDLIEKISHLNITLECGVQTLDEKVQRKIRRVNNKNEILQTMNLLHSKKVKFESHLIFGLPYQTFDSFLSDIKTLMENHCHKLRIFPLSLLRGTEIDVQFGATNDEITFAPIFPREVVKTEWMSIDEVYTLKVLQKEVEDNNGRISVDRISKLENRIGVKS